MILALVNLTVLLTLAAAEEDDFPVVKTKQGLIKGLKTVSVRNTDFNAFLGIPYAKPPVGELRFKVNVCVRKLC